MFEDKKNDKGIMLPVKKQNQGSEKSKRVYLGATVSPEDESNLMFEQIRRHPSYRRLNRKDTAKIIRHLIYSEYNRLYPCGHSSET